MSQTTLAIATLGSVLTGFLYVYIGRVVRLRKVSPDARLANGMFVLWWDSLGSLSFLSSVLMVAYMAGWIQERIWVYQAFVTFVLLVLFLALWGLQFYLLFLYTGSRRSFIPLAVFYGILFAATVALIAYIGPPETITDNGWQIKTEPEVEFSFAFNMVFSLLIIGPALATAIAYARLYRKVSDRTQRYRIALVTGAIIVWFGSSVIGTAAQVTQGVTWQLISRVIGIGAALAILMAYKPPPWVQARFGVESVETDKGPSTYEPAAVGPPPGL